MVSLEPLTSSFGVAVHGVDIARGVDDASMRALTEALYENRVIAIKDQDADEEAYLSFGRKWGTPIPHVLDHIRMQGYPEMLVVGNTEQKDKKKEIRNGAALWHTDQSYEAVPASATMLYSIKAPKQGGETLYCNMVAAYDDLEPEMKVRIECLEVAHSYGAGTLREGEQMANPIVNQEQRSHVPVVHHPLAMPHPVTGRKALYALGHGAFAIRGMDDEAAHELLDELKDHVLQEKYIYAHRYAVGDMVVWDTFATMHCAVPIGLPSSEADARLLWRISVRGRPEVLAAAAA